MGGMINDSGGLNGHPVQVIVKDDQNDPAIALRVAKELVEQDKVVALLNPSPTASAWSEYVTGKGVPVLSAPGNGIEANEPKRPG